MGFSDFNHLIWSPAIKHILHQSNKTCVALKHYTMNKTNDYSGKKKKTLKVQLIIYPPTEYMIYDQAEKLSEMNGSKTFTL